MGTGTGPGARRWTSSTSPRKTPTPPGRSRHDEEEDELHGQRPWPGDPWADRYAGKFDQGWDRLRQETFERQKQLGVIPADCDLTERSAGIPPGTTSPRAPAGARPADGGLRRLPRDTDHHVGLLIDALEELGILGETLIYVIIGDNGASAEGSLQGTLNEMITLGGFGALETPEFMACKIDLFGGPEAYNQLRRGGWANAMDTPYQWTKQVALALGAGRSNGTNRATEQKGNQPPKARIQMSSSTRRDRRTGPAHGAEGVTGLPAPSDKVDGVQQKPFEGISMA